VVTTNAHIDKFNTESPKSSDIGNKCRINTKDSLSVVALVAIIEPPTGSNSSRANKHL
jgi:hypothetical protein